jgi:hypothetical protein
MAKTAVVMIHGMGEQRPMDTLRGFVEAAWVRDRNVIAEDESAVYSKPDDISGSFELRRITTRTSGKAHGRCDFFEYYWAHLMTGNRPSAVVRWLVALLVRRPSSVPRRLVPHWLFGLAVLALLAFAILYLGAWASSERCPLPSKISDCDLAKRFVGKVALQVPSVLLVLAVGLLVLVRYLMPRVFAPIAGDAARYFTPRPDNIAARHAIRSAGVDLLEKLHRDGSYERIVLVAHSLGSAVGYDILTHAWGRIEGSRLKPRHRDPATRQALAALEAAAGALAAASTDKEIAARRADYRDAQRAYFKRLSARPAGEGTPLWLVSDFVTLGSPLSKADVLIAYDRDQLDRLAERREAPTCPPEPDQPEEPGLPRNPAFSFSVPEGSPPIPHHAAVLGPTVWTNIYFPNPLVLLGDLVAGETAPLLGRGIADVRLRNGLKPFRHLDYWSKPEASPPRDWIRALRAAINLRLLPEAQLWGPEAIGQRVIRAEDVPG